MAEDVKTSHAGIPKALRFPIDTAMVLRKRQSLLKELLEQTNLVSTKVAILGGSTTAEVKSMLELFLLAQGIRPSFYEAGYNRYREDVLFENPALWSFKPEIVFLHTTWRDVSAFPELMEREAEVENRVRHEMARFEAIWQKIHAELGSIIIQNNFDLPQLRPLGNLEASASFGRVNFLQRLNAAFASYARNHTRFFINDILYLSAQVGLAAWFGQTYWYNFHMAVSPAGTMALAQNVAGIVKSVYGKAKKCLVLDLDNTLWGGVIGDDGLQNLILGRDHPVGEAFLDFQRYVRGLRQQGVILAICSKNDSANAREGFSHPDTILKLEDFSCFKANWNPKPQNIREIADELNIGLDSIVFVDDNPAERALVAEQLPEVAVPEMGSDVSRFAEVLEQARYFEVHSLVQDDVNRAEYYASNAQRSSFQSGFQDYGAFLASLEMTAEIAAFSPVYQDRITQLINKTNQFNLTTRRYTVAEIESVSQDAGFITLWGRLVDKFGDNGLVSVIIAHIVDGIAELDLWLMSCRVLNREMEYAMFDALVEQCAKLRIQKIVGIYIPSKKNSLVANHYNNLGFSRAGETAEGYEKWNYEIPRPFSPKSRYIRRTGFTVIS